AVVASLELQRLLELRREARKRPREVLHAEAHAAAGVPLDDFFNVSRAVTAGDADSRADDFGFPLHEPRGLDAGDRPAAVELGPFRQIENLSRNLFGSLGQVGAAGEGNGIHRYRSVRFAAVMRAASLVRIASSSLAGQEPRSMLRRRSCAA